MKHTALALAAAFAARYPHADHSGTVDRLEAGAKKAEKVDLQAAGAVRSFSSVSGKLQWVRAIDNFYVSGECVVTGDFVEVQEHDAKMLIRAGRAELSSAEEAKA